MIGFFALAFVAGVSLGLVYRVFVLVPASAFGAVALFGFGLALREPLYLIVINTIVAIVAIQIGYLAGSATTFFIKANGKTPRAADDFRIAKPQL